MQYRFVFTKSAAKDIAALDTPVRKRLHAKLLHFSTVEDIFDVAKRLTDTGIGSYRLRVGNYRIIFDVDGDAIVVLRVQHRSEVYR